MDAQVGCRRLQNQEGSKKTIKRMMAWVYEPVMEMKEEGKEKGNA